MYHHQEDRSFYRSIFQAMLLFKFYSIVIIVTSVILIIIILNFCLKLLNSSSPLLVQNLEKFLWRSWFLKQLKQFLSFWKIQSQESHNTCGHGTSMTFLSFVAPVISNVAEQQISKEIDLHVLFKKPRF